MYYSEKFNSITHLVGAVLPLIAFGTLITIAIQQQDILLFLASLLLA
jgi:hemolysin III